MNSHAARLFILKTCPFDFEKPFALRFRVGWNSLPCPSSGLKLIWGHSSIPQNFIVFITFHLLATKSWPTIPSHEVWVFPGNDVEGVRGSSFSPVNWNKKTCLVTKEPKFNTHDSEFRTPLPLHIYNIFVYTEWMMWVIFFSHPCVGFSTNPPRETRPPWPQSELCKGTWGTPRIPMVVKTYRTCHMTIGYRWFNWWWIYSIQYITLNDAMGDAWLLSLLCWKSNT